jgi:hypothetical protein
LIGEESFIKRQILYKYCEITNSEFEYISITKDTTEHDLKQRKEIYNKNVYFIDQPVVRAALYGRILILGKKKN